MENVQPLLNIYRTRFFNQFCKLIQPLECLSINGFCHSVVTEDGHYSSTNNSEKFGAFYYSNRLFINNPFTSHPKHYQNNQFFITSDIVSPSYQNLLTPLKKNFGLDNCLIIYKKEMD